MWLCRWDATAVLGGAAQEQLARAAWVMGPPALLPLLLLPASLLLFQRCRSQLKSFLQPNFELRSLLFRRPKISLLFSRTETKSRFFFFFNTMQSNFDLFQVLSVNCFPLFPGSVVSTAVLVCLLIRRFGPSLLKLPPNGLELLL